MFGGEYFFHRNLYCFFLSSIFIYRQSKRGEKIGSLLSMILKKDNKSQQIYKKKFAGDGDKQRFFAFWLGTVLKNKIQISMVHFKTRMTYPSKICNILKVCRGEKKGNAFTKYFFYRKIRFHWDIFIFEWCKNNHNF